MGRSRTARHNWPFAGLALSLPGCAPYAGRRRGNDEGTQRTVAFSWISGIWWITLNGVETATLRRSLRRGSPFGESGWVKRAVRQRCGGKAALEKR